AFAFLAISMTSVGIYGLVQFSVTERTHEIGVRVALGAQPSDVLRLVLGQGAGMASIGIGIGLIGALGLTRLTSTLLYGIGPSDPATFVSISALVVLITLLASYIPARRAVKVDPVAALRYE